MLEETWVLPGKAARRGNVATRQPGFHCTSCDAPLQVETVRRPCPGVVLRYRVCAYCGLRVVTEERVSASRQSGQSEPQEEQPGLLPSLVGA